MGKLVLAKDWSKTPLGALGAWPQSLRTTVSLCLASNFPISIAWGRHHTQIYNDGYWPICGAKHPTSLGQDFSECWSSAWPVVGEAFERALKGETSYLEDRRMFLDRNGYLEETFFTFSFSPIRDETGGIGGLFHPVTETTSKMLSQRRIRALRDLAARTSKAERLQDVFTLSMEVLESYDLDLPFVLVHQLDPNGAVAHKIASTGVAPGIRANGDVIDLADPGAVWPIAEVVRTGLACVVEDVSQRFRGAPCGPYPQAPDRAVLLPISSPGVSRPVAFVTAGVSSRLPLNEVYRGFYDLLAATMTTSVANAQAYASAQMRAEALAEIDRAKTTFFSNVSHEFRTPLTLMLGPTEDALSSPERALGGERLEAVHRNALRLLKLVNTLLDFSRIESERAQASYRPVELGTITASIASSFRSAVENAGLRFAVDCPRLSELVYVDIDMWEKIVLNLLSNAFKFTFEGLIRVALRRAGDHAQLEVRDTGTGIPERELPRLFERFHRVQEARARTHEGSGIGLALVNDLVRLHGGRIEVKSRVGEGTTFTIFVPFGFGHLSAERVRHDRPSLVSTPMAANPYVLEALRWSAPDDRASTQVGVERREGPAPERLDGRPHVLVVDDNADLRDYVTGLLQTDYEVTAAQDGQAALEAIRTRKPDLLLSDVMMPRVDGFALVRAVRADPGSCDLPIILLSARAGEESTIEGLEAQADDYLVKPFSARELRVRVRTRLEMARLRSEIARYEAAEQDLRTAVRVRDDFLTVAAHELRTPLTALKLQADMLARHSQATLDAILPRAETIARQTTRLARLVDSMLDVSRLTAGNVELQQEELDLVDIVREVVGALGTEIERARTPVAVRGESSITGLWDRMRVEQIVTNLITNAIKFGRGRPVDVMISSDSEAAIIAVRDRGIGILPEAQQRIFDRFERAVSSRNYGGLGLGLWIAAQDTRLLGGKLTVDSRVGAGSTFKVELPRRRAGAPSSPHQGGDRTSQPRHEGLQDTISPR